MEKEQQQRFKEAMEDKSRDAEGASRASQQGGQDEEGSIQGDQESLRSPSQPSHMRSARDKNTRHKKVTADKWNQ